MVIHTAGGQHLQQFMIAGTIFAVPVYWLQINVTTQMAAVSYRQLPSARAKPHLRRAADVALYRSKERGRSRIVSFGMQERTSRLFAPASAQRRKDVTVSLLKQRVPSMWTHLKISPMNFRPGLTY